MISTMDETFTGGRRESGPLQDRQAPPGPPLAVSRAAPRPDRMR